MENQEIQQNWAVYIGSVAQKPAAFRVDLGLEQKAPMTDYPHRISITTYLKNPTEDGFPQGNEYEEIYQIEDKISQALEEKGAILCGVVTREGEVCWYYYTQDKSSAEQVLSDIKTSDFGYNLETKISDDANWEAYFQYLFPNIYEMQGIQNDRVRQQCKEAGDQLSSEREIQHWLYFSTETNMRNALAKIEEFGFKILEAGEIDLENEEPQSEPVGFKILASKISSPQDIDDDTWNLIDIALDHNGEYDGWETQIIK